MKPRSEIKPARRYKRALSRKLPDSAFPKGGADSTAQYVAAFVKRNHLK